MKVVSMIDPGVKVDPGYSVFKEGIERDAFLKYPGWGAIHRQGLAWQLRFPCIFAKTCANGGAGFSRGLVDAGY